MKNKPLIIVTSAALLLVVIVGLSAHIYRQRSAQADAPACVAGPDEQCPSDLFMQDYTLWQSRVKQDLILRADPNASYRKLTDLEDMMNGQATRLNNAVRDNPALRGYVFDETKKRFVRQLPPAMPSVTPVPPPIPNGAVPAAPPAKK